MTSSLWAEIALLHGVLVVINKCPNSAIIFYLNVGSTLGGQVPAVQLMKPLLGTHLPGLPGRTGTNHLPK